MEIVQTKIPDVLLVKPRVFGDDRGHFFECYHQKVFEDAGIDLSFVQDNQSVSQKGTLRGLHFQRAPHAQGKLVRVTSGVVFDVAVDIRPDSDTYGQWVGQALSDDNHYMLYVPPGFAHGFYVMSDMATLHYKCTDFYAPSDEGSIVWSDPDIGIDWPMPIGTSPILSEKDKAAPSFASLRASDGLC